MSERTYTISWSTGDNCSGLSHSDMVRLMADLDAEWIENRIVTADGLEIGIVGLDDD